MFTMQPFDYMTHYAYANDMVKQNKNTTKRLSQHTAVLRIVFGVVWLIDAIFKWQPSFQNTFLDQATSVAQGQPDWLVPWFTFWTHILSINPTFFAVSIALIETLVGLALIFGFARRFTYLLAVIYSLLIWSIPEGFGGPYTNGSTDVGAGIVYAVVFLALYGLDRLANTATWSIDHYISAHIPWWVFFANP